MDRAKAIGRTECPVTVLMAVHNGGLFLRTAIDSVLAQTYRAFCFLIVDDASTDATREIVRAYDDARIELVYLERNVGQTAALNIGLRHAATPWIARMDADDFSAPTRLEEQMGALERRPSLRCVGTFAWLFRNDPTVRERIVEKPVEYPAIRRELLESTPMIHGSITINRDDLLALGGYDERYRYSADRDLYYRFLERHPAANVPKPLLGVRQHEYQGSGLRCSADESIDIISRVLTLPHYTEEERTKLRASLSWAYRFRARCWGSERRYAEMLQDFVNAIRISPRAALGTFGGAALPVHLRHSIKRIWSSEHKGSLPRGTPPSC